MLAFRSDRETRTAMVAALLAAGADVRVRNKEGRTFAQLVREMRDDRLLRLIFGLREEDPLPVCEVCFGDAEFVTKTCGHIFCLGCLDLHTRTAATSGTATLSTIPCPSGECAAPLDVHDVLFCAADPVALRRLDEAARDAALRASPDFLWCPSCTDGGFVVRPAADSAASAADCTVATCARGHGICIECRAAAHAPLTCEANRLSNGESELLKSRIARRCPNCAAPTFRDGGCSHIRCAYCKYEWCWNCNGKYIPGFYSYDNTCRCADARLAEEFRALYGLPRSMDITEVITRGRTLARERRAAVAVVDLRHAAELQAASRTETAAATAVVAATGEATGEATVTRTTTEGGHGAAAAGGGGRATAEALAAVTSSVGRAISVVESALSLVEAAEAEAEAEAGALAVGSFLELTRESSGASASPAPAGSRAAAALAALAGW